MSSVDTVVNLLSGQLTPLLNILVAEANVALEYENQYEEMKENLELLKSFLLDTENLKHKKETLRATLAQVRDVVYDADDAVTDCLVLKEFRDEQFHPFHYFRRLYFQYRTGKKLKEVNSKMARVRKLVSKFLNSQAGTPSDDSSQFTIPRLLFTDDSDVFGLRKDIEKIKEWIFVTDGVLHQIGIVGMGGLGKTTVARKIFRDEDVVRGFDKLIWVPMSKTTTEEFIMKCILDKLGQGGNYDGLDLSSLWQKIRQALHGTSCLFVMDDVWKIDLEWWRMLCSCIRRSTSGNSCIIITTRDEDLALCMEVDPLRIHHPSVLNDDDSWTLFCKFAFSSRNKGICPDEEIENIGRKIVKRCGGLPLAIKTVSALLATKHLPSKWRNICDHFHEETKESNTAIMMSLQLSYDELPVGLKTCFLSFSIYPGDLVVKAEQLVNWWVGEGLVRGNESKTAFELGCEYLKRLTSRCLIEPVEHRGYDGRLYSCRMHDMVRELAIRIAEEEGFSHFNEEGRQKPTADMRWLGFSSKMSANRLKESRKLRALLLIPGCEPDFHHVMGSLSSLRVLDLSHKISNTISADRLLNWICNCLKRLAYLNLSGLTSLKELPSSIGKLRNLQLLILDGCINLKKLHPSIVLLKRLVILNFGNCPLEYLPQGLGKLSYLQELSGFKVASKRNTQGCTLLELKQLSELRVLRINISDDSDIKENELTVLAELRKLKVLDISFEDCNPDNNVFDLVNRFSPPMNLQELYLRCYRREVMPRWIHPAKLSRLQYLCIEDGDLTHVIPQVKDDYYMPWKLEGLCLKFLNKLVLDWQTVQRDMPLINYVEVSHCYKLEGFPCSVRRPDFWRKDQD